MIHFILMDLVTCFEVQKQQFKCSRIVLTLHNNLGTISDGHRDLVDYPPNMAQKKRSRNPPCDTYSCVLAFCTRYSANSSILSGWIDRISDCSTAIFIDSICSCLSFLSLGRVMGNLLNVLTS